ncbi:hypothetical protein [Photobacterium leiognathi]|uniref:hypothetical protein n=1 Tax=Photobacterium leiognathi TaxID=553611 RepID=UPI0029814908|nr:hypothetical protein [Photobacterium leiognathi]
MLNRKILALMLSSLYLAGCGGSDDNQEPPKEETYAEYNQRLSDKIDGFGISGYELPVSGDAIGDPLYGLDENGNGARDDVEFVLFHGLKDVAVTYDEFSSVLELTKLILPQNSIPDVTKIECKYNTLSEPIKAQFTLTDLNRLVLNTNERRQWYYENAILDGGCDV